MALLWKPWQEFQESRIGKNIEKEEAHTLDDLEKAKILKMLEALGKSLHEIEVASDISPVESRLEQIRGELARAESWNPSELERELGSVFQQPRGLFLKEDLDAGILENLEKEIKSSLKLYKKRVSADIYRQLFDKQFKQRILDLFGLPEFSLISL